jgi:hypothetical protein
MVINDKIRSLRAVKDEILASEDAISEHELLETVLKHQIQQRQDSLDYHKRALLEQLDYKRELETSMRRIEEQLFRLEHPHPSSSQSTCILS